MSVVEGGQKVPTAAASASTTMLWTCVKLLVTAVVAVSAYQQLHSATTDANNNEGEDVYHSFSRRLQQVEINPAAVHQLPSYMSKLADDLRARKKLFDDTPPEEIKYWFEYSGPLQVGTECVVGEIASVRLIVWFVAGIGRCLSG